MDFNDIAPKLRIGIDEYESVFGKFESYYASILNGTSFSFTDLQEKAFSEEDFWNKDRLNKKHIVIKGATSSGKTLVSEMAILDCLKSHNNAIVLVPLKAMVRERVNRLKHDFDGWGKIYGSSSDYQDNDANIIEGNFNIIVIVYEKFFAMLAQNGADMMKSCGLLVVDELQMISSRERGPKLEICIQKVLLKNSRLTPINDRTFERGVYTRIMCLTTCDCGITNIEKWLKTPSGAPLVVKSDSRPVGLEENIITFEGSYIRRYIRGERDESAPVIGTEDDDAGTQSTGKRIEGQINVEGYNPSASPMTQKSALLYSLLKHIYKNNSDARVLVFVGRKSTTKRIAREIANSDLFQGNDYSGWRLMEDLKKLDHDEAYAQLERLLKVGVAFHDSSLSTYMREYIEKYFSGTGAGREDRIRLVVATETLTVGMNMPVDVMILYDYEVPRSNGETEPISVQAYKNYVGRAGRLGLARQVGKSYLFARDDSEMKRLKNKYFDSPPEEIVSGLYGVDERGQAPYFLSLIHNDLSSQQDGSAFLLHDLMDLQKKCYSNLCYTNSEDDKIDMDKMTYILYSEDLCSVDINPKQEPDWEPAKYDSWGKRYKDWCLNYRLDSDAASLAPFALSLVTCRMIKQVFKKNGIQEVTNRNNGKTINIMIKGGGVPQDMTAQDLNSNKYLLDLLYTVCNMPEIRGMNQFEMPKDPSSNENIRDIIGRELQNIYNEVKESNGELAFWKYSFIKNLFEEIGDSDPGIYYDYDLHDKYEIQDDDFTVLRRTILLWYWTRGTDISQIGVHAGVGQYYKGDLMRMAEMAGYLLEAASKVIGHRNPINSFKADNLTFQSLSSALYNLSTEVYYGMPRELVFIANRHVYGIDRDIVLKIGEAAKKNGYATPVEFLKTAPPEKLDGVISESLRSELVSAMENSNFMDDITALLKTLGDSGKSETTYMLKNEDSDALLGWAKEKDSSLANLELFFAREYSDSERFFNSEKTYLDKWLQGEKHLLVRLRSKHLKTAIIIGCYDEDRYSGYDFSRVFQKESDSGLIVLISKSENQPNITYERNGKFSACFNSSTTISGFDVWLSMKDLSYLLTQTIYSDDRMGTSMFELLMDARNGRYQPGGLNQVNRMLKNYRKENGLSGGGNSRVKILLDLRDKGGLEDSFSQDVLRELRYRNIPHEVIQWGTSLRELSQKAVDTPIVLLCIRRFWEDSQSVDMYVKHLRQHRNINVLAVFRSDEIQKSWTGDGFPDQMLNSIIKANADEVAQAIADYLMNAEYESNKIGEPEPLIGISYAHNLALNVDSKERPAVTALKKLVEQLNYAFGMEKVFFDGNPCWSHYFVGNYAKDETLDLYRKCKCWIVLNDEFYMTGSLCPHEYGTIREAARNRDYSNCVCMLKIRNGRDGSISSEHDYTDILPTENDEIRKKSSSLIEWIRKVTG